MPPPSAALAPTLELIAEGLRTDGIVMIDNPLPDGVPESLLAHLLALPEFRPAGVGRDELHTRDRSVRSDLIYWLDPVGPDTRTWFDWIEQLRLGLNRQLLLGLFDYECHYASYEPGSFYRRHYDAFRGGNSRVVTTILYLNPEWQPDDGGELVVYRGDEAQPLMTVIPQMGRMVFFLSEEFPHEVRLARSHRYSLTGWFRINTSIGGVVDPPR